MSILRYGQITSNAFAGTRLPLSFQDDVPSTEGGIQSIWLTRQYLHAVSPDLTLAHIRWDEGQELYAITDVYVKAETAVAELRRHVSTLVGVNWDVVMDIENHVLVTRHLDTALFLMERLRAYSRRIPQDNSICKKHDRVMVYDIPGARFYTEAKVKGTPDDRDHLTVKLGRKTKRVSINQVIRYGRHWRKNNG